MSASSETIPFSEGFPEVSCGLCGADDFSIEVELEEDFEYKGILDDRLTRGHFRIVRCRQCDLVYLNPQPTLAQVLHYYPDAYCCFAELPPKSPIIRVLYQVLVRLKARELLPLVPEGGTFLDFGCGTGHWLIALAPLAGPGRRFVGVDASERAVTQLRDAGIEAHVGVDTDLDAIVEPGSVDLVLLNHVIEHVPSPPATLARLARALKPGGHIHGACPNIDAWDRRLFGVDWAGGWHTPRHFSHFERKTFRRLVDSSGLEVVELKSSLEAASHWAVAFQTVLGRRFGWHPKPGQLRMPIYPLILATSLAITALQMAVSRTSVMTFTLRKPA